MQYCVDYCVEITIDTVVWAMYFLEMQQWSPSWPDERLFLLTNSSSLQIYRLSQLRLAWTQKEMTTGTLKEVT